MTQPDVNPPEQANPGLLRSSAVVGSMTMLSRVLGLLRDVVIAAAFGAALETGLRAKCTANHEDFN